MSARGPASTYAAITRAVNALVAEHSGNDLERAAYMVMRAAALSIMGSKGPAAAAAKAYQLADELATGGAD